MGRMGGQDGWAGWMVRVNWQEETVGQEREGKLFVFADTLRFHHPLLQTFSFNLCFLPSLSTFDFNLHFQTFALQPSISPTPFAPRAGF